MRPYGEEEDEGEEGDEEAIKQLAARARKVNPFNAGRHGTVVVQLPLNPRFLSYVTPYDVATPSTPAATVGALQMSGGTRRPTHYAVLVGGSNGDGAWRGPVTIVESIDPRPYIFSLPCTAD